MQIKVERSPLAALTGDALVVVAFEGARDERFAPALADLYASGEIAGKALEMTLVHQAPGSKARRLLLVGGGGGQVRLGGAARRGGGGAVSEAQRRAGHHVRCWTPVLPSAEHVAAAVEGALLGDYDPDIHKSDKKDERKVVERSPWPC